MNVIIPRVRLLIGNNSTSSLLSYTKTRGATLSLSTSSARGCCCLQLLKQSESWRSDSPILAGRRTASFSSSSSNNKNNNESINANAPIRLEDANPERISGIKVNPDSLGMNVLPGNLIYKKYKLSGNTRKIPLELAHGYFWMLKDLKNTNQKPTLSNEQLIPARDAQLFPTLKDLNTLDDSNTEVDLPLFFQEKAHQQQSRSGAGKITLVAIAFRDNGFKLMPTWTVPFEEAFQQKNDDSLASSSSSSSRVQTFHVSITEGLFVYPLRGMVRRIMKNNTPISQQSKTLTYFGTKEVMEFRDVLRMHNIMTSYVFLLDDLGRVRFAGSGEASDDEVKRLIEFAEELVRESDPTFITTSSSGGGAKQRPTRKSTKKRQ
jgi:ATPase complex subunit ATP10